MAVTVLGLTGYAGLLPWFYTRLLIDETFKANTASGPSQPFAEFLDCFNHPLISLQYRAWEKHRLQIPYERNPLQLADRASIGGYVLALLGLSTPSVQDRLEVSEAALAGQAGALAVLPRSALALRFLLRNYFGVATDILQFQARWCRLRPSEVSVLGGKRDQNRFGGAVLGRAIWYPQASFRVCLKVASLREFVNFRPGGKRFGELIELVEFFTRGIYQEFEVELLLPECAMPSCRFAKSRSAIAPRLGWVGWLGHRRKHRPVRGTGGSKSVVFRSDDPRALLRRQVSHALRRLREAVRQERHLELEWTDGTVDAYCQQVLQLCGDPIDRRERIDRVLALLIEAQIRVATGCHHQNRTAEPGIPRP